MTPLPIAVMYFSNETVRGGAEEHMLTLMRGLDRELFRVHLTCPAELAEKLHPDLPTDVEVMPLSLRQPRHLGAAVQLGRVLRRSRIGILHSHNFYGSLFASPTGWFARVPVIVETPHVRELWRKGWLKSRYVVDRLVGRFVDHYVAVSNANARYLTETKRLPVKKITVIHNGCDLQKFLSEVPAPVELRKTLGFNESDPILLLVGRLEPQKGHAVLLEALKTVQEHFPRTRLVCAGEGALRNELEARTRALGLTESVRFVGYQRDISAWLALANITVLPSFYEGLPIVAIESLAAGRPMVATAVDGSTEVIVDGRTGLTVPSGDPPALAVAICRLIGDPKLCQQLGQQGRAWVYQHFDEREQIRRTQDLYLRAWKNATSVRLKQEPDISQAIERSSIRTTTVGSKT
jgi:glycosyltransferase involved in cell wall biosynthesis